MAKSKTNTMSEAEREAKRLLRHVRIDSRVDTYEDELKKGVQKTMRQRVAIASQLFRDKVVANLSKPVRKISGTRTKRRIVDPTSRSKEGEFPRADTTRLMKDIFVRRSDDGSKAQIGTTLGYGLILETKMKRSFLRRTFNEFRPQLTRILGSDVGGRFRI